METWNTRKELGMAYENCPYCGDNVTRNEKGEYHCDYCDISFNDEEMEHEELRHALSAYICNRDEDSAVDCYVETNPANEVGGPILIDKVFEFSDGTQWAHFYGTPADEWVDIDEFCNDAIKDIVNYFFN